MLRRALLTRLNVRCVDRVCAKSMDDTAAASVSFVSQLGPHPHYCPSLGTFNSKSCPALLSPTQVVSAKRNKKQHQPWYQWYHHYGVSILSISQAQPPFEQDKRARQYSESL